MEQPDVRLAGVLIDAGRVTLLLNMRGRILRVALGEQAVWMLFQELERIRETERKDT